MKNQVWRLPLSAIATVVGTLLTLGMQASVAQAALLVGNTQGNNVLIFDELTGELGGEFIAAGSGGLIAPDDLTFGPDGNLYISSGYQSGSILRFDGKTGEFLGRFDQGGTLFRPYGVAFGPDGNLYVSSFLTDEIVRYNGVTGDFVDIFAKGTGTANGLNGPNDLLFGANGDLYVTTQGSVANGTESPSFSFPSQILKYNIFAGSATPEIFDEPEIAPGSAGFVSLLGLTFDFSGNLLVSDFANAIRRYDLLSGTLLDTFSSSEPGYMGNLTLDPNGNLYTVTFDFSKEPLGLISRFDAATGQPLPAPGQTGSIFVPTTPVLKRPIGIAYASITLPEAPTSVPEPSVVLGLLAVGLGAKQLKRNQSQKSS